MSAMDYTQLPDGTWKKNPKGAEYEPKPVQIWYMRDDHTFCKLPLNVDAALAKMRVERDAGCTHGMLYGKPDGVVPAPVHASSAAEWPEFEDAARPWLDVAVARSKPPCGCQQGTCESKADHECQMGADCR